MRFAIVILFLAAVASLGYGLTGLLRRGPDSSERLHKALRLRIAFSVALFLLLLLAWKAGLIQPHGLGG